MCQILTAKETAVYFVTLKVLLTNTSSWNLAPGDDALLVSRAVEVAFYEWEW